LKNELKCSVKYKTMCIPCRAEGGQWAAAAAREASTTKRHHFRQLDSFGTMFARRMLRPSALCRRLRALSSHSPPPSDAHLGWTALGLPLSLARAPHPLFRPQLHPTHHAPRPCSLDHFVVLRRRRRSNMLASTSHPIPGNTSRAAPALALRSNHFARLQSLNCADLKPFSADIVRNERHNQGDFFCFVVLLASVQHGALPFPSTSPQPVQSSHFRPAHSGSHWQWQDIVVRNLSLRPHSPLSPPIASYALPLLSVLATAHMPVLVLQPNRLEIVSALSAPSHPWSHCRLLRAGCWWSR
jgi:hypothetical protein